MVANIFRTLMFLLLPSVVFGQSLHFSGSSQTANNNPSTFSLDGKEVTINDSNVRFLHSGNIVSGYEVLGISPDYSIIGLLKRSGEDSQVLLLNTAGDTLSSYPAKTLGSNDPSLAIYPFNNGSVLLRDNITNFTFYDTFGGIANSTSSSSQSEEGELISEVAMSPGGTVVIYNPKIKRNGELGSKAQVMLPDGKFENIFFSTDRYLKDVTVSRDGNVIVAITAQSGTDDQVLVMDKFGNELNRLSADQNLVGATISDDAEYLTLYSGGRVMVFRALDSDRLGATSFRKTIFLADYFPGDNMLLVLTGNYSANNGILNNAEFRAIDLEQREITSRALPTALGFHEAITPKLVRLAAGKYQLLGSSRQLIIETDF